MTGLVGRVRNALDPKCIVKRKLNKKGCAVSLQDAPKTRLVVDFDKPGSPLSPSVVRCDYLVVAEGEQAHSWVAVLELKRGKLHAGEVVRQLRAGASAAEKLVPQDETFMFRPIAASGNKHKHDRKELRKQGNRIRFHGTNEAVRLISCGGKLVETLKS